MSHPPSPFPKAVLDDLKAASACAEGSERALATTLDRVVQMARTTSKHLLRKALTLHPFYPA